MSFGPGLIAETMLFRTAERPFDPGRIDPLGGETNHAMQENILKAATRRRLGQYTACIRGWRSPFAQPLPGGIVAEPSNARGRALNGLCYR
jgi:hypothetical protein